MMGLGNARVRVTLDPMPSAFLAGLKPEHAAHAADVSARPDTASLTVENNETGKPVAYAVFGFDDQSMVTIYAAEVLISGAGPMMLKAMFGASRIVGQPMRVHSDKVRAMARAIGADVAIEAVDGDGLPMGIFSVGQ